MIKVIQFGEGNFLRTFTNHYFDCLNKEGEKYSVNIVKPINSGTLDKFKKQNNVYHIILRGIKNGKSVEAQNRASFRKIKNQTAKSRKFSQNQKFGHSDQISGSKS